MTNRPKLNQSEMTSACKILQEMLKHSATKQRYSVGGGLGISPRGGTVLAPAQRLETYDEDTNALIRAKFACDQNMVVSPLSQSNIFYTTSDNFQAELDEAQRRTEEEEAQKNKGWFSRLGFGKKSSD